MSRNSAILHAVYLQEGEHAELDDDQSIFDAIESQKIIWIHLDMGNEGARGWLTNENANLDPIIIDALLAEESRPRVLEYENGILLILRGVNLNADSQPEDMVSIRLWIDERQIVSVRRRPLKAVIDLKKRILAGKGPTSAGDFVARLTMSLLERMEPTFLGLDEVLDDLEEKVMEDPRTEERQAITAVRKKAILFKRYISPQRDAISTLKGLELSWLSTTQKRQLQEAQDRITRYVEDLDMIRERASIVKDELVNALSDRMNKNLYILSVIAAIFLPLGFLTGLFGINVAGMPGTNNPIAFTAFTLFLIVVVILQIILFKRKKWF